MENKIAFKKIMMVGPQGSGKTTQAKILAEKLRYKYLGTGEMFREIIQKKEPGYEKIITLFEKGQLVEDTTTCEMVKFTLSKPEFSNGIVIDGYPRTVAQKNIYDPNFDIIIYIKVADEIAIQRLSERGRADDTPEAIAKRLELYHHETGSLLDIFLNEGKLWVVDGEQSVDAVTTQIFKRLNIDF